MKNIKTIIFDLGGVLMDLDKQKCIEAFEDLGFSDITEYLGEYEQKGMFMDLEDGTISATEFRDEVGNISVRQSQTNKSMKHSTVFL
ncbi:MAG: hypothetical protein V8R52_01645 [Coprobacter fastidiosus]